MDKTPNFTAKINEILKDLKPHNVVCLTCQKVFEITDKDIEFFNKFKVPTPRKCPECRRQIRLAFANYTTLFKRNCDVPSHEERIISSIPEGAQFSVYDFDYYWYGNRDLYINGKDFDFGRSFLEQFNDLFILNPQPALTRNPSSINSEYSSYGIGLKNCYYIFGGMQDENVMFSVWPMYTKDSLDILISLNSNLIYEGVYPENCYNCKFAYFSSDCVDCSLVYDCRNCQNCFGCVNLRNKKYCIGNKQYSKEEYCKKIQEINLNNILELKRFKNIFYELIKNNPVRGVRSEHSDNFSGNYIFNSKKCSYSFWVVNSENVMFTDFILNVRDTYDCTISANNTERLYGTSCVGNNCSNVKFSSFGRELQDCEYTMNCKNCINCFGCIGLVNAKFCIFNKQYNEDEYWKLIDEIKCKMLVDGEYGEFFPLSISPFPYNASLSNIMYPISKEKVLELGGWWYDDQINLPKDMKLMKIDEVDSDIKNIKDEILEVGIISEGNGKPFRIVKEELEFYRRKNIAIPTLTPYERIINRFKYVNNFKVFKDKCFNCGIEILSSYATSDGYKPYCDECYKKEIY